MKAAVTLNGNIRTFFMPTRENPSMRVCDFFKKNIVDQVANCDIYICCDITDFYLDDIVYHVGDTIETTNNNGFRVYKNIKFVRPEIAKELITSKFKSVFDNIKSIVITEGNMHEGHKNFLKMKTSGHNGIASERLVNQHNKILILKEQIEQSGINYDFVFRSRLDHLFLSPLIMSNYNLSKNIVYTPGFEGNRDLCYDWYIFGEAATVLSCMNLFHELDCEDKLYVMRSKCCPLKFIKENNSCIHGNPPSDVTIASEVQLARMCKEKGIVIQHSRIHGTVYRYYPDSTNKTVQDVLPKDLTGIKWVDYTAGPEVSYGVL
jgi:hypothetical protein